MISRTSFKKTIILSVLLLFISVSIGYAAHQNPSPASLGGTSSSVGTDPNTGAANVAVPIEVPSGRKGMAPNLALTYNSNKRNGWLGVGWEMKTSFIQRNTKWGLDYNGNDYVADGNRELTRRGDWGTNYYGHKTESAFIKYYYNSSTGGWEATTKDGTKHYYGTTSASRHYNSGNPSNVFKWMIDRVEDTNGNYMTYTYTKNQEEIYLNRISYTGGNGLSPLNYVQFNLESRTDVPLMYNTGTLVKTAFRLKNIEIYANGQLVRKYQLNFEYGTSTGRSRLTTVQQYGSDGSTMLPATTINWNEGVNNFASPSVWMDHGETFQAGKTRYSDMNGDGKSDLIYQNSQNEFWVSLSAGSGFASSSVWMDHGETFQAGKAQYADMNGDGKSDLIYQNSQNEFWVSLSTGSGFGSGGIWLDHGETFQSGRAQYADVNGDGKADLIFQSGTNEFYVSLSTGSGFGSGGIWLDHGASFVPGQAQYPDVNGDGKTDLVFQSENNEFYVSLSTGSGFGSGGIWLDHGETFEAGKAQYADMNGDGKSDLIYQNSQNEFWVSLSTGSGFASPSVWMDHGETFEAGKAQYADMNGDGKPDLIYQNSQNEFWVSLSTGSGFASPSVWMDHGETFEAGKAQYADVNGDGKADLIYQNSQNEFYTSLSDGSFPDLISTVSNGVGGTTTIAYIPSTQYVNDVLPFVVQTVSSISVNDGNGNTSTTNYTYSGGHYDIADREFRGFEYVKATDPVGTISETWFKQDDVFKGLPDRQETRDSSGNLYSKSEKTFRSTTPFTGVDFPYLSQSDDFVYDGTGTANNIKTTFVYDSYGNITEKHLSGNTAVTGDERDEYTEYDYGTSNWIVSLPNHTYVNNDIGTKVSEAWFTYDTSGNLLTDTRWNDSGASPVITYTYDNYGNQTSITAPRGNTTTITYDPTSYIYPFQATNPLGYVATTVYDHRYGKIISETDTNNQTTTYTYDVFGRRIKVAGPRDTGSTFGTETYFYQICQTADQRVITYSTEEHDTAEFLESRVCLDGLERTVKTWKEGPDNKTIVQDIEYDNSGRVYRQSLPYFDGGNQKWKTYTYDPVGRVIQVTNPDGTYATTSYNKGTTTYIDAAGHKKVEVKDVYGRLIKVEEYMDASLYATTTYEYNTMGNLLKVTDTQGNQTTMSYDTLGRKKTMDDPDMGAWSYAYDANGNLLTQTNPRPVSPTDPTLQTVTFEYDELNRVEKKISPTDPIITYKYDETFSATSEGIGRLSTLTDASGITKYYYDKLGRTKETIKTVNGTPYSTKTTYDALGRTKSVTYPDLEVVNYTYDTGGNLASIYDGTTTYASYSGYNALGQNSNITYGNGVTTDYTYETNTNRLSTIVTKPSTGADFLNLSYAYDNADNITSLVDGTDATYTQNFSYDDLDRLTDAYSDNYGLLSYAYDTIGNITSKRGVSYTYGSSRPHAVTETDGGTNAPDRALVYNDNNKPSSIDFDGEITDFVYSGVWSSHNRAKKVATAATTVYIGNLYEKTGSTVTKYIFAGGTRVAMKTSTGTSFVDTYYYHQDHLGSSRVITDSYGNDVEYIHYYPYGETLDDTGDNPGNFSVKHKFTSQELDSETGLYYYGARCYDPVLGRFTTADTLVPDLTNPQALNRYSYVLNNPLKYTDPTGHGWWKKLRRKISGIFKSVRKPKNVFAITATVAANHYLGPVVGGAVGGAAAAAITGGDIGKGALFGGLGGAAYGAIDAHYGSLWKRGRVFAYQVVGGTIAQLSGGKFKDGFFITGITANARYLYNKVVGYGIRLNGGKFVAAKGQFTRPVNGANNIGEQGPLSQSASWFKKAIHEGGAVSRFANHVPVVNAIAGLHDVLQVSAGQWIGPSARSLVNIPGMPIAGGVTIAGAMANPVTASYLATDRD